MLPGVVKGVYTWHIVCRYLRAPRCLLRLIRTTELDLCWSELAQYLVYRNGRLRANAVHRDLQIVVCPDDQDRGLCR